MISLTNNILFHPNSGNYLKHKENNTVNNFIIVNKIFDLTDRNFNIFSVLSLPEKDRNEVLKMTSRLLKRDIVGFEILDLRNRPYKSYIQTKIASDYAHLKPYRKRVDYFI